MLRGKAMFYAVRLFKYRSRATSVKTPTAIIGVRGTKFGVEVRKEGGKIADARPIYLAAAPGRGLRHLLAQVLPSGVVTVAHCFTGAVDMTALADNTKQTIHENESRTASSERGEDVNPTPPDVARQFESATKAPDPAAAKEESQKAQEKAGGGGTAVSIVTAGEESNADSESDAADKAADAGSTQTDLQIETQGAVRRGYFSGMLTKNAGGTKEFAYLYLSHSLQNARYKPATAHDSLIGKDLVVNDINQADDQQITALGIPDPYSISGFPYPIQSPDQGLGSNAYMGWGYWTQTQAMPGSDGNNYYFDNRGYYIFGDVTSENTINLLKANSISGSYSGEAFGTFWTDTGGVDMTGTFSAQINFGDAVPITNFEIDVSGPGHSVCISGAEGRFTDPQNPSHFVVPSGGATGSWKIDGVPADTDPYTRNAYGSVYGPNAEAVGGVWKIDATGPPDKHATGVFQGVK